MHVQVKSHEGHPVLVLMDSESDRYPYSFGLTKAKKILNSINYIEAFVAKYDKPKAESTGEALTLPSDGS